MENIKHFRGPPNDGAKHAEHMLCLNAGSSSLKFKLFSISSSSDALISGSVKLSSDDGAEVEMAHQDGRVQRSTQSWVDIASASVLSHLLAQIASLLGEVHITRVVHRVVHGAHLPQCVSITRSDQHHLGTLQYLAEFAPLHNAVSVALIRACLCSKELDEGHENICCFDTAFHRTLGDVRGRYMIALAGEALPGGMQLRRWGFHGLSYASVLRTLARALRRDERSLNVILCHLGSGSSMCSIVNGKSFDTSMGLTPLEGLPGSTRSGSVDPVLALHLSAAQGPRESSPSGTVQVAQGIEVSRAELVLNKQSGFKGVAGTGDFREIVARRSAFLDGKADGQERQRGEAAALAFDIFVDRIVGYLGSYAIKMSARGGVDALVFSGGIGEASSALHRQLAKELELSTLSPAGQTIALEDRGGRKCWQLKRQDLGLSGTQRTVETAMAVPWFVCKTDEEGEMAREVLACSHK